MGFVIEGLLLMMYPSEGKIFSCAHALQYGGPSGQWPAKSLAGPKKLTLGRKFRGDNDTIRNPFNKIEKSGALKDCEGPQKYDIKGHLALGNFRL